MTTSTAAAAALDCGSPRVSAKANKSLPFAAKSVLMLVPVMVVVCSHCSVIDRRPPPLNTGQLTAHC